MFYHHLKRNFGPDYVQHLNVCIMLLIAVKPVYLYNICKNIILDAKNETLLLLRAAKLAKKNKAKWPTLRSVCDKMWNLTIKNTNRKNRKRKRETD